MDDNAPGKMQPSKTSLTRRERQVVGLVAAGLTSRQIGEHLGIGASTVDTHVATAARKLGLRGRVSLAATARIPGPPEADDRGRNRDGIAVDTWSLVELLSGGHTIATAARRVGLSSRTAARRIAQARAITGTANLAGLVASATFGRDPSSVVAMAGANPSHHGPTQGR